MAIRVREHRRRTATGTTNVVRHERNVDRQVVETTLQQIQAGLYGMDKMLFKSALAYKKIKIYVDGKSLILYDGSKRVEIKYDEGSDLYIIDDGKTSLTGIYNDQLGEIVKDRFKKWF